ncbi:TPA: hypothetical protein ACGO1T_000542 [Streptococcus suis]
MAFVGNDGSLYSFSSEEFLDDLKSGFLEFGGEVEMWGFYFVVAGVKFYNDYNFILDEIEKEELNDNDVFEPYEGEHGTVYREKIKLGDLLALVMTQNEVFNTDIFKE